MTRSLRSHSRRIAITLAPFFLALPIANAAPADWMSGQWGIGWRFTADDKSQLANWDVSATVAQVKSIPGVTYVLFNLTDAAHGDAYIAPHSVLTAITPSATPDNDRDLFLEVATAFQAEGIKVIAYVATQGPAMLKHGAEKAFDKVEVSPGVWTSQAMDNWEAYVLAQYGNTTEETYKQAFAEVIIDEYAARYGTLIDGWWFDHSGVGNIPLLHDTVTAYNPNVVIAFNEGQKIPLTNNNPDYEDYTFGHPTPVASAPASSVKNLPMLTSIEATADGFFNDAGRESLGHMFMPMAETWNSGAIVWTVAQAADWQERCINAGGAWTWNVDISPNSSSLRADTVTFMNDVITEMALPNTAPVFSQSHIAGGTMDMNTAYSGSLAGLATDADADTLSYIKATGPDWLTVASDGTLSGTPDNFAVGMNRFIIVVSDGHGGADVAELEIYVQNDLGNGKAYLNLSFNDLRANLSSGSINGLLISDPNVTAAVTSDGNDAIMSLSITNQNLDGIGGDNDTLSWDIRVEGYSGGTYTLNGNNSSATLGTSVLVGAIDNEFGVSGTDLRFVDDGESIQYSVENMVITTDAIATAQFDGFNALWGTTGSYILGTGASGLESITLAANGELPLSAATVLTFTSTGKERLRDPGGAFTIYPNNAPFFVASSIQVTGDEGTVFSDTLTNLAATATDPDGDPLTYSKASGPAWLSVASDGTLSGTPGASDAGLNTFIIEVEDPWAAYDTLIVEVTVDQNTPPVSTGQSVTTAEDTAKVVTLTGTDADGDTLTAVLAVLPDYGTVSLVGNVATYTPNANFNGSDRFKFRMSDGIADDIATVVITVNAVNDEPIANAQGVGVNEDGSVAMTLSGSDVDGDSLTYSVVAPANGSLSGTAPNLTYTPNVNFNGADSFTFTVNDGTVDSTAATVSITVTAANDAPLANAQGANVNEDDSVAITLSGSDVDGDSLTYSTTAPANGSLSGTAPNLTYTPNANFNGADSFTFTVNDGTVDSAAATVSITVNAVNDAPVANAQGASVNEDDSVAITLSGSDTDGDSLTYSTTAPANGSLSGTAPNLTYTPNADFNGADSFTFTVNDGTVDSTAVTVSITVNAVNDAPVADAQGVSLNEGDSVAIALSGSDTDGDSLTYSTTAPSNGSLSGTAPNLTYTPNANFNGADSFTFTVNDGTVNSAAATVSITVNAVNDAPVANAQGANVNEDDSVAITLSGSDTDGDSLTYSTTAPANGSLSGTAPNLTYTPNTDFNGADSFTFTVNDGTVDSAEATVTITVTAVNDAPVFSADPISSADGMLNSAYSGSLSATDIDGDSLSYSAVSGPAWLSVASNGSLSGTPQSGDVGSNSWTVAVTDGNGGTDQAQLNVTVTADPIPGVRVTEYYLTTGDFSGTTTTVTLNQNLADDYYILVRGSRTGDEKSFSDNNYARITAVPNGKGELAASGAANQIVLSRYVADFEWEGVVTVVECDNSLSDAGFKLVDIVETSLTGTSGTDTSAAWNDATQVVLFGGYRGGGASFTADTSSRNQGSSVHTRLFPSGTNTLNWSRNSAGETLIDAVMTTFVVEWGSEWTVQHVNVTGSNGGNGADTVGEYTAASISNVSRANSWVWATGSRADAGIGDCAEACLVTLGDGVSQNATESSVSVGSEYTDAYDFDVYVLTHTDIAVDYRFLADGNIHALDLPVAVDTTTPGARFGWVYNGVNGTGTWHPRSIFWARYTADGEVTISRGFDGQNFPAWVQGVDLSGLNN